MNQIFNEIEDDLKQDKFINFLKKYKLTIIIFFSLLILTIFFIVGKNIIFENRAKKYTQEYVVILSLINDKKIVEAKNRLEILKDSKINQSINIPTIGIGASNNCDGQILVTEDLLGFSEKPPKFVKMYDNFKERTEICIKKFVKDLKNNNFPNIKNMYQIS